MDFSIGSVQLSSTWLTYSITDLRIFYDLYTMVLT